MAEDTCLQVPEPEHLLGLPQYFLYTVEILELLLEGQLCKEIKVWNPEFKPDTDFQQGEEQRRSEFAVICPVTLETGLQTCPDPCVNKGVCGLDSWA